MYRRLGRAQNRHEPVRKISPLPQFDPRTVQTVASRYTDYATLVHAEDGIGHSTTSAKSSFLMTVKVPIQPSANSHSWFENRKLLMVQNWKALKRVFYVCHPVLLISKKVTFKYLQPQIICITQFHSGNIFRPKLGILRSLIQKLQKYCKEIKILFRKKLKAHWSQEMLAIVRCRIFLSSSLLSKNLKIEIYGTIILPAVMHGCETWSLTLRDESRLRVFEKRVLRRIYGLRVTKWQGSGENYVMKSPILFGW
jgi:hypothetical protein